MPRLITALSAACLSLLSAAPTFARAIYVNNRLGDDRNDGYVAQTVDASSGPVKTLARAIQLSRHSDTIELTNTGIPYYESVSLVGKRLSGASSRPFEIIGNGAVLSGATAIPDGAWQKSGDDLWMLKPWRKGFFVLISQEKSLSELRPAAPGEWTSVPSLTPNQWCVFKGLIYFKSERLIEPQSLPLSVASHDCGITLYGVQHVRIANLTIRHFRTDGIGVHDLARNITLENVSLIENGRAGLAVGGSADVRLINSFSTENRDASILVSEAGSIETVECHLDKEPILSRKYR